MNLFTRLRTYAGLGPASIARVGTYRLGLKTGWHPVQKLRWNVAKGPFLRKSERRGEIPLANTTWDNAMWWFGWHHAALREAPPDWFANPFSDKPQPDASHDWWNVPDFGAGDIKGLWELSRFDWVIAWATKAAQGDAQALNRLNNCLEDWARENPPYKGPNWKCGQEASFRVMHLVAATWVLGQDNKPEHGIVDILLAHLQRIAPTMSYAIGQQNNHGTSEAAALFIGGSFLLEHDSRAAAWMHKGRRWLEERAKTLIESDGSFSQYSVTYHRVMLDSYALAEAWRRYRELPEFSSVLYRRLSAATRWLDAMIESETGDAPNIGANDGARLLPLTGTDYRDFRPSVQLAAALFEERDAFGDGPWTAPLRWLSVRDGVPGLRPKSVTFGKGGYHVLRAGEAFGVLRYPRFRFRPSQADALHFDLWTKGVNLLRDAGTYSYNADGAEWFSSTAAHNTIEFDGRSQMPRLGRFLFGNWVDADLVETVHQCGKNVTAAAGYTDPEGARHHRQITLDSNSMVCRDTISGPFRRACLRWRLAPGPWDFDGQILRTEGQSLSIEIDGSPVIPTLTTTIESRHYQHQSEIPVALVIVDRPTQLITKMTF